MRHTGGEQAEEILRTLKKDLDAEVRQTLNATLQHYQSYTLSELETKGDYLSELDYIWVIPNREYLKNLFFEARLRLPVIILKGRILTTLSVICSY